MPRIFINLEAGCLQVNLMSTSAQINQLKYTILYYTIFFLMANSSSEPRVNLSASESTSLAERCPKNLTVGFKVRVATKENRPDENWVVIGTTPV